MMRSLSFLRVVVLGVGWILAVGGCTADKPAVAVPAQLPGHHLPSYAMIWPSEGPLVAPFGPRGTEHHDGIDILGVEGRPVRAALGGEVLFAGSLPGYGNVVILKHANSLTTVYAHNQKNQVEAGQQVRRGEVIALLGKTGRATAPNLHFEVRRRNEARDPMQYLPRTVADTQTLDSNSGS